MRFSYKLIFIALLSTFSFSSIAGQYATALGQCMYKNMQASDKKVLTQWAFVQIGRTDAAKEIASIPSTKRKNVNDATKKAMSNLLLNACASEASKVILKEGKSGLTDSVNDLASRLIRDEINKNIAEVIPNVPVLNSQSLKMGADVLKSFIK